MTRLFTLAMIFAATPAAPVAAWAQTETAAQPALSDRMAPLTSLVGEWRGEGWMTMPGGERVEFTSREIVTPRLSGAALLVEGQHRRADNGELIHDAMGMIVTSGEADYRFRTALGDGRGGDFPFAVGEDSFSWTMTVGGGRIDYASDFSEGVWREHGTFTSEGGEAIRFFEMTLRKQ